MEIAHKYELRVVEDCAQSHGARFDGQMTGTFGDIGCFSFYPSKNLGAFGDACAIVTNDDRIAEDVKVFRNYGSEKRYYNRVAGTNLCHPLDESVLRSDHDAEQAVGERKNKALCSIYQIWPDGNEQ